MKSIHEFRENFKAIQIKGYLFMSTIHLYKPNQTVSYS